MNKIIGGIMGAVMSLVVVGRSIAANAEFATDAVAIDKTFGGTNLTTIGAIIGFLFNMLFYIGWASVFIGIAWVIVAMIYKLMNSDSEEAMKTVQGYITKAILVAIAGLLLLSMGYILVFVGKLLGYDDSKIDSKVWKNTP